MSTSTDAILFFGYQWEYGVPPFCSEDGDEIIDPNDWETYWAAAHGINPPKEEYPSDRTDQSPAAGTIRAVYAEYWDKKRALAEVAKCRIDTHCCCEEPMPYLAIKESRIVASRGFPEEVTPGRIIAPKEWHDQLRQFAEKINLKLEGEPKWWLVSYWG